MFNCFILCRNFVLFLLAANKILIYLCIKHVYDIYLGLRFNSLIAWKMVISFRFSLPLENFIFYSPGNSCLSIFCSLTLFSYLCQFFHFFYLVKNFVMSLVNFRQYQLKPWIHYGYIPLVWFLVSLPPFLIIFMFSLNIMWCLFLRFISIHIPLVAIN